MDITGRTALVTGGARGIGRELTRQLSAKGAHVVIVGRDHQALEEMRAELGNAVTALRADLTCQEEVDRVISIVADNHGALSILINNAATQTEMDFLDTEAVDRRPAVRREIALNLDAAICLSIGLLPLLRRQTQANIVNVSSGLAIAPKQASPVYCATKAGLRSFSKALRYQCAQDAPHIRIVEIIMALVDTDMTRGRGKGKISSHRAAREIVAGIERNLSEIWVAKARLLRIVNRLSPALAERMLK
jgi:uncharacterized oxidoreductase